MKHKLFICIASIGLNVLSEIHANSMLNILTSEPGNCERKNNSHPCIKTNISKTTQESGKILFFTNGTETTTNAKSNFTSKDFIYGRLELTQTIASFFGLSESNGKNAKHINYEVRVLQNGEEIGKSNFIWNWCYVSQDDHGKNYFEFDVLPEPSKAKTVISPLEDFSAGKASAPMNFMISPQNFPKTDKYTIEVILYRQTVNGYGNPKPKEEWPTCKGEFEFNFNEDDIPTLKKNSDLATENVKNLFENKKTSERNLPEEWNKTSASISSGYTELEIRAMITYRYKSCKINKLVIMPARGGWVVEKNDVGIPLSKYFDQPLAIFITDSNNKCFYIEGYVNKTYEGGGKYGSAWLYPEKETEISCEKIKSK